MKLPVFLTIITAVLMGSVAQLFLKYGVKQVSAESCSPGRLSAFLYATFSQPAIWAGLLLYGVSFLVWVIAISKVDVSVAYPMLAIGFIFTAVFAHFFLGEAFSCTKFFGVLLIALGTYFISRSAAQL